MIEVRQLSDWRGVRDAMAGPVGFVPTMGALHRGHASLIERSVAENPSTVLSIYVNPTQFNDPGDLERYPCTLEADLVLARRLGVTAVLLPSYAELYPDGFRFRVEEQDFSRELCGRHRPGHFTGVLTVVMKLFNVVRPNRAYFGEKDHQQFQLIRDMTSAFFLAVEVVACPTVREDDGLALSSRNALLSASDRRRAPELHEWLTSSLSDGAVRRRLAERGFEVDYVETRGNRRFGAAGLGPDRRRVRLIDNVALSDTVSENNL